MDQFLLCTIYRILRFNQYYKINTGEINVAYSYGENNKKNNTCVTYKMEGISRISMHVTVKFAGYFANSQNMLSCS